MAWQFGEGLSLGSYEGPGLAEALARSNSRFDQLRGLRGMEPQQNILSQPPQAPQMPPPQQYQQAPPQLNQNILSQPIQPPPQMPQMSQMSQNYQTQPVMDQSQEQEQEQLEPWRVYAGHSLAPIPQPMVQNSGNILSGGGW